MRSRLFILANLVAYALALPTDLSFDRRHFGSNAGIGKGPDIDMSFFRGGALGIDTVFHGLSSKAAAALEGSALGCKAGSIDAKARKELHAWLSSAAADHIDGSLKGSLSDWCLREDSATLPTDVTAGLSVYIPACAQIAAKGGLIVSLDGIVTAAEAEVGAILDAAAEALLSAFLSGSDADDLDADIKAGLHLCAAGGIAASLTEEVKDALEAWLSEPDCSLEAALKGSVLAWLKGNIGGSVVAIGNLVETALSSLSVGASIGVRVEASGALTAGAQLSVSGFLATDVAVDIDADIKGSLEMCAKGGTAASMSVEKRAALAAWIARSDCSLTAELKGIILFWFSIAVGAERGVTLPTADLTKISAYLVGSVSSSVSAAVRGALSVCAAGERVSALSSDARAELASFLAGGVGVSIDADIILILIKWTTECTIPSSATSAPSVPSASAGVPSLSIPSIPSASAGVPSLPKASAGVPNLSIPSIPSASAGVPSLPKASASVPSIPSDPSASANIPSVPSASGVPSIPSPSSGAGVPVPSVSCVSSALGVPNAVNTVDVSAAPSITSPPTLSAPTLGAPNVPVVTTVFITTTVTACGRCQ
jgi:hypothetical protein